MVFLDELDAMVHKRSMGGAGGTGSGSAHSLESRILSTLLNEMDGMQSSQGVLVVAATNRLDMIDDALLRPGRFDNIIYVRNTHTSDGRGAQLKRPNQRVVASCSRSHLLCFLCVVRSSPGPSS